MSSSPEVDRFMQALFNRARCAAIEATWDLDQRVAEFETILNAPEAQVDPRGRSHL